MSQLVRVESDRAVKVRLTDMLKAVLTWLAADTIAGLAILAAALAVLAGHGHQRPDQMIEALTGDFTFVVTTTCATSVIALVVIWRLARKSTPKPFAAFFSPVPGRMLLWAVMGGLAVMAAELALESALKWGAHIPLPISKYEQAINPETWIELAVALPALALVVPFFEEVLFRGYIFGWLKRVTPLWLAVIVSAAVFAAVHGLYVARGGISGWVGTVEIFGIGVLLAFLAARSRSLRPGFVAHAVINAVSFGLGFFFPAIYP